MNPVQRVRPAHGVYHNRTRRSASIPRRLVREGKVHLLPLYALLRTSDLAREGIENSGSYGFADHVYRGRPGGSHGVGRLLDAILLQLRGTRSLRNRYFHALAEILAAARRQPPDRPFRVLSVPCGIARELIVTATILRARETSLSARSSFFGMDLDPVPLEISRGMARELPGFRFIRADALDPRSYPTELDVIVSAGLGEFLDDDHLVRFYAACHAALREGGRLVTSATRRDRLTDYLMRELAELHAHYREPDELVRLLRRAGYREISARSDEVGFQTLLVARTGSHETTDESGGTS